MCPFRVMGCCVGAGRAELMRNVSLSSHVRGRLCQGPWPSALSSKPWWHCSDNLCFTRMHWPLTSLGHMSFPSVIRDHSGLCSDPAQRPVDSDVLSRSRTGESQMLWQREPPSRGRLWPSLPGFQLTQMDQCRCLSQLSWQLTSNCSGFIPIDPMPVISAHLLLFLEPSLLTSSNERQHK